MKNHFKALVKQPKASRYLQFAISNSFLYFLLRKSIISILPEKESLVFIKKGNLNYESVQSNLESMLHELGEYFLTNANQSELMDFRSYEIQHEIEVIGFKQKALVSTLMLHLSTGGRVAYSIYHLNLDDDTLLYWTDIYDEKEALFEDYKQVVELTPIFRTTNP